MLENEYHFNVFNFYLYLLIPNSNPYCYDFNAGVGTSEKNNLKESFTQESSVCPCKLNPSFGLIYP